MSGAPSDPVLVKADADDNQGCHVQWSSLGPCFQRPPGSHPLASGLPLLWALISPPSQPTSSSVHMQAAGVLAFSLQRLSQGSLPSWTSGNSIPLFLVPLSPNPPAVPTGSFKKKWNPPLTPPPLPPPRPAHCPSSHSPIPSSQNCPIQTDFNLPQPKAPKRPPAPCRLPPPDRPHTAGSWSFCSLRPYFCPGATSLRGFPRALSAAPAFMAIGAPIGARAHGCPQKTFINFG